MKFILKNLAILIILSIGLSSFTGCGKTAGSADEAPGKSEEESGYPPIPEPIADAEIKLTDGSTFKVADNKGKVILINLWATWCGPCRREMPELVIMEDKYKDEGFMVLGLDVDSSETLEQIKPFAEEMKLNYKLGWAKEDLVRDFYGISRRNGIPQSFLINREGELTGVFFGGGPDVIEVMKKTVEKIVKGDD